jgi:aspartate aminotransferase-like enzyme
MGLLFKIARSGEEMEQIHQLNYRTFVEEIPQHPTSDTGKRVDPFHAENTYLICLKNNELIGMIAIRDKRPFSIDKKIGPVEEHLPFQAKLLCEIRLLAVDAKNRNGRVFLGLTQLLANYCIKQGYDAAVISGTTRQTKLYNQLGFTVFHDPVGTEDATFHPMYITRDTFEKLVSRRIGISSNYFIPGPVLVADNVANALQSPPISHRSKAFLTLLSSVKERLLRLTRAAHCQLILGSGTLANEVIAMQLRKFSNGVIFINGEFGKILQGHATRAGLSFKSYEVPWGKPFSLEEIQEVIHTHQPEWIWFTHCETSTGVLNSLDWMQEACKDKDIKICVDAISSLGAIPVNLSNIYLASGVSGKAIGSYSGVSIVFHQHHIQKDETIPGYLDLGMYIEKDGVPFTHSSNLIAALHQALEAFEYEQDLPFESLARKYQSIREYLESHNIQVLSPFGQSCPIIMTIPLPTKIPSSFIGEDMEMNGYLLHYESSYLKKNNWIQISPINNIEEKDTQRMLASLTELVKYYESR